VPGAAAPAISISPRPSPLPACAKKSQFARPEKIRERGACATFFHFATLFGATLFGATLFGATLFGATLFGATLFGATKAARHNDHPG
jgi:uncharacterized protein YjbI with pentapeptide repeats